MSRARQIRTRIAPLTITTLTNDNRTKMTTKVIFHSVYTTYKLPSTTYLFYEQEAIGYDYIGSDPNLLDNNGIWS